MDKLVTHWITNLEKLPVTGYDCTNEPNTLARPKQTTLETPQTKFVIKNLKNQFSTDNDIASLTD